MFKKLLLFAIIAGMMMPMIGCSDDDDDPPPPPPSFGPSAIMVGETGTEPLIALTNDMLSWSWVLQAESLITSGADLVKVVKVPNTNRLVVIASLTGTDVNDEIWYNESGGSGLWLKASFGAADVNLDPEHIGGGLYDEFSLNDIFFVNSLDGYAVGNRYIVLRTYDGGLTWYDMNSYHTDATTVMLDLTGNTGDFLPGETVDGLTSGAAGTVVSWDPASRELVVTGVLLATLFSAGENISNTGGSGATGTSVSLYSTWMFDSSIMYGVFATEDATFIQTIWIGLDYANPLEGMWKIVTDGTAGAARSFTWTPPTPAIQTLFDAEWADVYSFFFFDATTGVCGTRYGIFYTEDAGVTWTQDTTIDTNYWVEAFCYSSDNLQSDGYLYTVWDYLDQPIRMAVTYAGTAWTLDTTNGWVTHGGTALYVDMENVDGASSIFFDGGKIFASDSSSSLGVYGWAENVSADATGFDTTYWTDTTETFLGGDATAAIVNQADDMGALSDTLAPSGWMYSMCKK